MGFDQRIFMSIS